MTIRPHNSVQPYDEKNLPIHLKGSGTNQSGCLACLKKIFSRSKSSAIVPINNFAENKASTVLTVNVQSAAKKTQAVAVDKINENEICKKDDFSITPKKPKLQKLEKMLKIDTAEIERSFERLNIMKEEDIQQRKETESPQQLQEAKIPTPKITKERNSLRGYRSFFQEAA